jgi:hypothetical protein
MFTWGPQGSQAVMHIPPDLETERASSSNRVVHFHTHRDKCKGRIDLTDVIPEGFRLRIIPQCEQTMQIIWQREQQRELNLSRLTAAAKQLVLKARGAQLLSVPMQSTAKLANDVHSSKVVWFDNVSKFN